VIELALIWKQNYDWVYTILYRPKIYIKNCYTCNNPERFPPEYQEILKKFTSDTAVLDSLKQWIKKFGRDTWAKKTIEVLKQELDI
jgi:hypothetical protein